MVSNYLEQMAYEWFDFKGYIVKSNVFVDRRPNGGYNAELDIVAFHPVTRDLVHLEASMDAQSWADRKSKYIRKFAAGDKHIPSLFPGFPFPPTTYKKIILLGYGSSENHKTLAGAEVMTVSDFLAMILKDLKGTSIYKSAISEDKPILRTLQFFLENRKTLANILSG